MNIMKYIIILYFAYWGDLSFAESVRSLDLRTYDFEQLGPINLEENWQMRWMDLTHPDQVHRVPWQSIGAAKLWSKTTLKDRKLDGKGYASYRLSIDFPNKPILLAFARPEIATAFTIFLNGKEFWSSGRVGGSLWKVRLPLPRLAPCPASTWIAHFFHKTVLRVQPRQAQILQ